LKVTKMQAAAPHKMTRKRAAGYARVSSGKDAMLASLSAQVAYYSQKIQANPKWLYCGVYADEDYTGTKDARPEFQRLLADCRAGKIDVVLTKSISRMARNTVTLLETLREFRELGVAVFFEREGLWSNGGDGELLLTILASYAQEESRSASENCIWRIRKQFAEGKPTPCKVYGYRQEADTFTIIPEEAAVVKQMFADYLSGMGALAIQKKLLEQGTKFSINALRQMLRNEKYRGDLLLQKSYTRDHLSKRRVKNTGQLPMYLVENNHPAIVDRAAFDAVQAEVARRAAQHRPVPAPKEGYAFSGLIRCGICGAAYRHKIAGAAAKYKKSVWICSTFNSLGKAHCLSQMIPEDILRAKVAEAGGMESLREIIVPGPFSLSIIYIGTDGDRQVNLTWRHPSRRDSWTDEMKQAAREKSLGRVSE